MLVVLILSFWVAEQDLDNPSETTWLHKKIECRFTGNKSWERVIRRKCQLFYSGDLNSQLIIFVQVPYCSRQRMEQTGCEGIWLQRQPCDLHNHHKIWEHFARWSVPPGTPAFQKHKQRMRQCSWSKALQCSGYQGSWELDRGTRGKLLWLIHGFCIYNFVGLA